VPWVIGSGRRTRAFRSRWARTAGSWSRWARWLVGQGFQQFLDIGTGLPTSPNLHEVVQAVDPAARVVYVDNDPLIMVHARALLTGTPQGSVTYLEKDLRDPGSVVTSAGVRQAFDLTRPVAVSIIAVLQHIVDDERARAIVAAVMRPLAAGSALALSVVTVDHDPDGERTIAAYNRGGVPAVARTHDQVVALFGDPPPGAARSSGSPVPAGSGHAVRAASPREMPG
jgi:hypothetical protein